MKSKFLKQVGLASSAVVLGAVMLSNVAMAEPTYNEDGTATLKTALYQVPGHGPIHTCDVVSISKEDVESPEGQEFIKMVIGASGQATFNTIWDIAWTGESDLGPLVESACGPIMEATGG